MGDVHRLIRCRDKKFGDTEFEKLLTINPCRLERRLSPFFTRPAYQYTKAEVGGVSDDLSNVRRIDPLTNI